MRHDQSIFSSHLLTYSKSPKSKMLTKEHQRILQEISLGLNDVEIEAVADKVGLPVSLTTHFLEELTEYGFIYFFKQLGGNPSFSLKPKGQAAIDSPEYFIDKPMNPQTMINKTNIFRGPVGVVANDRAQVPHFTQNNNTQNLTEAAREIQTLIDQLAQSYPTTTMPEKVGFASAIVQQIDTNPSLSDRVLSASKVGGTAALGQFLNHPVSSFVIAAIEDWQSTKRS